MKLCFVFRYSDVYRPMEDYGSFSDRVGVIALHFGGIVVAVDARIARRASEVCTTIHMPGRAMMLWILAGGWFHFILVHANPALPMSIRRQLFTPTSAFHAGLDIAMFMLVDRDFMWTGAGTERDDSDQLATAFERAVTNLTELFQPECNFRRLVLRDVGRSGVSRINTIYASLHPLTLEGMWVVAGGAACSTTKCRRTTGL